LVGCRSKTPTVQARQPSSSDPRRHGRDPAASGGRDMHEGRGKLACRPAHCGGRDPPACAPSSSLRRLETLNQRRTWSSTRATTPPWPALSTRTLAGGRAEHHHRRILWQQRRVLEITSSPCPCVRACHPPPSTSVGTLHPRPGDTPALLPPTSSHASATEHAPSGGASSSRPTPSASPHPARHPGPRHGGPRALADLWRQGRKVGVQVRHRRRLQRHRSPRAVPPLDHWPCRHRSVAHFKRRQYCWTRRRGRTTKT
jgi:hypothetical protein